MFAALAAGILVGNVYLKHLFARYPLQNRVSGVRVFVPLPVGIADIQTRMQFCVRVLFIPHRCGFGASVTTKALKPLGFRAFFCNSVHGPFCDTGGCKNEPVWQVYNRAYKQHYARYMKKKMTVA